VNEAEPGPPARDLKLGVWELAWPSTALFGLHALVGLVDFLFVGTLGAVPLAAVGVAMQIQFLAWALVTAVTTGVVAIVARDTGAGRAGDAGRAARTGALLAASGGALLLLALPWADALVRLLGVEPEVVALGGRCLRVLLVFQLPMAVGAVLGMALRGAGDVRTPLAVGIAANAVNVVADYALVFGRLGAPELGAVGSAWATGAAFATELALFLWLWERGSLVLPARPWREGLSPSLARRILRIGVPSALEQAAFSLGLLLFLGIVAEFGTPPVSAYLIGVRILSLCFVPGFGFSTAASTIVGQYLGAGQPERAARLGWRANRGAMAVMGSVGVAIIAFSRPLAGAFGAVGQETIDLTVLFIWILGAAQPLMAVEFTLGGALRGAGDTRFPLAAILIGLFVFRLGTAVWIARPVFGDVAAVYGCLLLDYAVKALLLSLRFARGRWKAVEV
jgi:putative MATE family efflux protein